MYNTLKNEDYEEYNDYDGYDADDSSIYQWQEQYKCEERPQQRGGSAEDNRSRRRPQVLQV